MPLDYRSIFLSKIEELEKLQLFGTVSWNALNQATKAVQTVELRKKIGEALAEPTPDRYELEKLHATKIEEFALAEQSAGFPELHGLLMVRLWTLLEALIDELITESIREREDVASNPLLMKLKGPLMEFRAASQDEQAEFLTETLKQSVDASLKTGIGRFESILEAVGLAGPVDSRVRQILLELGQVRNAFVHKNGRADKRLLKTCSWLRLSRGDRVPASREKLSEYVAAVYWYLLELKQRSYVVVARERDSDIENIMADLLSKLTRS